MKWPRLSPTGPCLAMAMTEARRAGSVYGAMLDHGLHTMIVHKCNKGGTADMTALRDS